MPHPACGLPSQVVPDPRHNKENPMLLQCPHCDRRGDHVRSDFIGDWVVCHVCELPFAWRDAGDEDEGSEEEQRNTKVQSSSTRNER